MKNKCKFNRNRVKFCLNFCAESCWKMPVTNGNFISRKKERKILTIRYVEIQNLLLHNSSLTNCYCTEIVLSKLAPQEQALSFPEYFKVAKESTRNAQSTSKVQLKAIYNQHFFFFPTFCVDNSHLPHFTLPLPLLA